MGAIKRRARELLAEEYVKEGRMMTAKETMDGHELQAHAEYIVLRAIAAAIAKPAGGDIAPSSATQEMIDAGAAALLSYRKSGGDYRIHPTHAVEAAINAALCALTPPEGYVLVPVEPTYEMMTDACNTVIAMSEMKAPLGKLDPFTVSDCVWKAMLSARPEVPNVND